MKIFVIGGTGLMGPHLVREIEAASHKAICFNRRGNHPRDREAIIGDRSDAIGLRSAIMDSEADLVIDMIPYTEKEAIDLGGILNELKKPLIACSSVDVYRAYNILHRVSSPPYQKCPIKESDELRSRLSIEGKAYDKLHVEQQYLSLNVDVSIFRLPAIYGWPDQRRIKEYVDQIRNEGTVKMHPYDTKWRCSRALNENCAFAISLGIGHSGKHVYNVAEPIHHTEEEWCRIIGRHLHWDGEIVYDESIEINADANQDWFVDTQLIREELGYKEKYDCDEGLRRNIFNYLEAEQGSGGNS